MVLEANEKVTNMNNDADSQGIAKKPTQKVPSPKYEGKFIFPENKPTNDNTLDQYILDL